MPESIPITPKEHDGLNVVGIVDAIRSSMPEIYAAAAATKATGHATEYIAETADAARTALTKNLFDVLDGPQYRKLASILIPYKQGDSENPGNILADLLIKQNAQGQKPYGPLQEVSEKISTNPNLLVYEGIGGRGPLPRWGTEQTPETLASHLFESMTNESQQNQRQGLSM